MKSLFNIGNEVTKNDTTVAASAEAITKILKVGADTRTEQQTIREAIKAIGELSPVNNVNVNGSTFIGSQTPDKPTEPPKDDPKDDEENWE